AEWISGYLFSVSICRIDPETHQQHPIPADTIHGWRNRRDQQAAQFLDLFARCVKYISLQCRPKNLAEEITLDVNSPPLADRSMFEFVDNLPISLQERIEEDLSDRDLRGVISVLEALNHLLKLITFS